MPRTKKTNTPDIEYTGAEETEGAKLICPCCKKPITKYVVANGVMYCSDECVMKHLRVTYPR
jgi:hypothetical protein